MRGALAALLASAAAPAAANPADRAAWVDFQTQYRRAYATAEEAERRFGVFVANMREAERLRVENPYADFGMTKFSDRTAAEFRALLGSVPTDTGDGAVAPPVAVVGALPTDIDWTGRATTPVKDQGSCGSCWAFSAVEQVESDFMLQKNATLVLGVQEVVDCNAKGGMRIGCTGGNPDGKRGAYEVIKALGGIELEKDYPYRGLLSLKCQYEQSKAVATLTDWAYVGKKDETEMKNYVGTTGPLSVCVNAQTWHSYKSGVMTKCSSTSTDHCVQIVGYGTDTGVNGTKYWKVRNSWNTDFGENGYLRIARGHNLCNINSAPTKTTAGQVIGPQ